MIGIMTLGCTTSVDPVVESHRKRFVMSQEPPGAVSIATARKQLGLDQENEAETDVEEPNRAESDSGTVDPSALEPAYESAEPIQLVLEARVGSSDDQTWEPGKAEFMVSEVLSDDVHGGEGHDPETCPFCQLEAGSASARIAVIRFLDEADQLIEVDARTLLGVEAGQEVVVSGTASVDPLGVLVIAADGIYLR